MLTLKDITYRIAGRTLFDKASLFIPSGYHVGFIGANGTGKSTLFKIISGELELDDGEVNIMSNIKVGMVRQDLPDDETSLLDVVLSADKERHDLLNEAETATDPQRIADIYARLDDIGAYEAPSRASIILSGLGFDDEAQNSPINSFSGGWRMRVALAAALFLQPDLLLLDEPTNHLDFEAIIWLENYLMQYQGTFIIISHDREILNKTVDHIVSLEQLQLELYTGNYDQFETTRAQKRMNHQALFEKQQAQKNKMLDFVRRFGAKASKAKQAQSRLKAIEKMDLVDALISQRSIKFKFLEPEELGSPIITIDNVDVGYEENKPILKNLNLSISMYDRIALLGANGNGKSTLIKLLSNKLKAQKGNLYNNSKLRIGYFAQHQTDELDVNSTAYMVLKQKLLDMQEPKIRALLGKFGFDKAKSDTKIASLSGGEKARLLFCMMSYNAPHIMLLDEPTNHLDIDARVALIDALNNYQGCVILVSHDPYLVESVVDQLWLVKDGRVEQYNDDLENYKNLVIQQRRKEKSNKKNKKSKNNNKSDNSKKSKNKEKLLIKAEDEYNDLLKDLSDLEKKISSDSAVNDNELLNSLLSNYNILKEKIQEAEDRWIKLQE